MEIPEPLRFLLFRLGVRRGVLCWAWLSFMEDEEFYCPICGALAPAIVLGQHHCDPEILAQIDNRTEEEESPPYGERLQDGFNTVNPYGDSDY